MKVEEVSSVQKSQESMKVSRGEQAQTSEKVNKAKNLASSEKKNEKDKVAREEVEEGLDKLNEAVQAFHEELEFKLHEKSERMMVEVVNIKKHEVIKEIPPKEVLDMIGRIKEMVGILLDKKI